MRHADRDALIPDLLPAFRGIPWRKSVFDDLADVIEKRKGRAVTLTASELRAIAERIRDLQFALEQATLITSPALSVSDAEMRDAEREAYEAQVRANEALARWDDNGGSQ